MKNNEVKISKFLSLVLRHKPETIALSLDENGWAETDALINKMNQSNFNINLEVLKQVVKSNDKQRFGFNQDFSKIRANQGHSLKVDLQFEQKLPPSILYHGTAEKNIDSIKTKGLLKRDRHHVHLSGDPEVAKSVGKRYGKPIILTIESKRMSDDGIKFFKSENGVWLTEHVDTQYINFEF